MGKTIWFRDLLVVSLLVTLSGFNTAKAQDDPMSAAPRTVSRRSSKKQTAKPLDVPMVAAPVKLAWDASPGSVVAGYALYYRSLGNSSVTVRLDVGTAQAITVPNLEAGSLYMFSVVACNGAGVESPASHPIVYHPPALSPLRLSKQTDGTMSVQFRAAAGSLCRVECTSTLTSPQWQTLRFAIADANGNVVVNDPPAGRPAMRFYRGVRQ
jgi:hypothetical protein